MRNRELTLRKCTAAGHMELADVTNVTGCYSAPMRHPPRHPLAPPPMEQMEPDETLFQIHHPHPLSLRPLLPLAMLLEPLRKQFVILAHIDRKSTRLNSSHSQISYAVF